MATYFNKYYFEFRDDIGFGVPVTWRVDIMDSEGSVPTDPILLEMGATPLIFERVTDDETKTGRIIGEQATIEYIYTGAPNEPQPEEFFESSERRFRVEIRRNGVLNRVFFIRPDECQYPEIYPPYTVVLKAVDGYSFARGTLLNVFQESGLLLYDKVQLYDLIMTRGLLQVLEPSTAIRVLQTLYPENIEPGEKMLFGISAHIDIFYDFVTGAQSVHDVVSQLCQNFFARCFNSQAKTWFVRMQDLDLPTFTVDEYTDAETVTEVSVPDMVKLVGTSEANDGIVIMPAPFINMKKAVKRAEFEVEYKGINQVLNFDWVQFDGTMFDNWDTNPTFPITVQRIGSGTAVDPYRMFIPYPQSPDEGFKEIRQVIPDIANLGDGLDVEIKVEFSNTKLVPIRISLRDSEGDTAFSMDASGKWQPGVGSPVTNILLSRSGNKRITTFSVKSEPIPVSVPGITEQTGPFQIRIQIGVPRDNEELEPSEPDGVAFYPIKIGVFSVPSRGRHLTAVNQAEFSQVLDVQRFSFIDTGGAGMSNTLFTGDPLEPAANWDNDKPDVSPTDIERHMAEAYIDQAPRSPKGWEGTIRSNSIDFHNVIEFTYRPGVRFMQITDRYTVHNGTHEMILQEIFTEGNAEIDYSEHDIEDLENE